MERQVQMDKNKGDDVFFCSFLVFGSLLSLSLSLFLGRKQSIVVVVVVVELGKSVLEKEERKTERDNVVSRLQSVEACSLLGVGYTQCNTMQYNPIQCNNNDKPRNVSCRVNTSNS